MSNSIVSLERIKLGGINQWISIRGKNTANPVLLYLHGGPGTPVMPLFRHFQAPLEKHYIVVQSQAVFVSAYFYRGQALK